MANTDPIADYLTRIRNAQQAGHRIVEIPSSKMKKGITEILYDQGYILKYKFDDDAGVQGVIKIALKYNPGTKVPVELKVTGDAFTGTAEGRFVLTVSKQVDMEFKDGKPTGIYRINGGLLLEDNDALFTRSFRRKTDMTHEKGPVLVRELDLGTQRSLGGLLGD